MNPEKKANIITAVAALIMLCLVLFMAKCTPTKETANLIKPTIDRLEKELKSPDLPDSVRTAKEDSVSKLRQSQQIAELITGSRKLKGNNFNIAINGDATAHQRSKVKDQHKEKSSVKEKDLSKVKEKPVTKSKEKPVSKSKPKQVTKIAPAGGGFTSFLSNIGTVALIVCVLAGLFLLYRLFSFR